MRTICFYFQVHQPYRLKPYRFFDIGEDHHYWDDFSNKSIMRKVAQKCYLPMNALLLELIEKYNGAFKVSFSLSGVFLDQLEEFAPDVLESFQKLVATGHCELLNETYAHALVALKSKEEFKDMVQNHQQKIKKLFNGYQPKVFRNTELIYSDEIGKMVSDMGFDAILTEGAKHVLGWKSPNYVYCNSIEPKLKVLLKNFQLSDDIAFRFGNKAWDDYPLTTEKFINWINEIPAGEEVLNLFMDYETFGEHQWAETGIFDFMRHLPEAVFSKTSFSFSTPSEVSAKIAPVGKIHVPIPISWADEERDLTAWLGNDLQDEAFDRLYEMEKLVKSIDDEEIQRDWTYLQTSDHFYYMCTKFFSDGDIHSYFSPYDSPYDAFINYMNVLSDFMIRVKEKINEKESPKVK
ncbi:glycoside hydrolase family 57 protein [Algoriphagus halophytocola]|uniref:Glycoside hydrolase family 57 protein n=1 Tax=Algoriphagus halophytocola TaxID=2991499 RepID=A0ABY6MF54_9BACT|nr:MULTISPECIES: glycoside hydrolase family 57 protein [unclassified Algoriphagus]UZD20966.1 glycoside hydrolase family 57 protein [Algoriphagus sp. TR-M5]WBL42132.1 glycoside hydrolase family 57 protein [Algoriphagus sp. TR-M9]